MHANLGKQTGSCSWRPAAGEGPGGRRGGGQGFQACGPAPLPCAPHSSRLWRHRVPEEDVFGEAGVPGAKCWADTGAPPGRTRCSRPPRRTPGLLFSQRWGVGSSLGQRQPSAVFALFPVGAAKGGSLHQTLGHLCYPRPPTLDLLFSLGCYYPALFPALLPNT